MPAKKTRPAEPVRAPRSGKRPNPLDTLFKKKPE
jgi:hypothetical protein